MNDELRDKMVREWGLAEFSKEEQDKYIDEIGRVLYQAVVLRATGEMNDEQQAALDKFMDEQGDKADMATCLDFLRQNVANFDALVADETEKLRTKVTTMPK